MSQEIINTVYDGKAARKKAQEESELSDMKQHADKLYQGFKKLNENDTKRAIWELFQNAIDISEECEITIVEKENSLEFSHNGQFFNSNTLISLIKQVSSKPFKGIEEEDETEAEEEYLEDEAEAESKKKKKVGQYGTGFITTHAFGRKIILNSCLLEEGLVFPLRDFEIDRTCEPNKPSQLTRKLIEQRDKVFDIIEVGESVESWEQETTFAYIQETELQKRNVEVALARIHSLLPYVIIFNDDLKKVIVKRLDGATTIYQKEETYKIEEIIRNDESFTYKKTTINKDGFPTAYFYLEYKSAPTETESDLFVVLPLSNETEVKEFDKDIAKLFLYFPLIGSESFGFNYIIHSRKFQCTEPRDGLYLNSSSEENKEDERINQELLQKASSMIFEFIRNHDINLSNTIKLGKVNFNRIVKEPENENDQLLANYFIALQEQWVENLKSLALVEANEGRVNAVEASFFSNELINGDDNTFRSIYKLATKFWSNIPKEEIAIEWTNIVNQWSDKSINFITFDSLLESIKKEGSLNSFQGDEEAIKEFYRYLIDQGRASLFNTYAVLPNINNDFIDLVIAKSPVDIEDEFIKVAKVIIPNITDKFINEEFSFNLPIEPYDREALNKDIKTKNSELNNEIIHSKVLDDDNLFALINYCSIFPKLDNKGKRGEIIDLICQFHQRSVEYKEIPNVTDKELDFIPITRTLLKDTAYRLKQLPASELDKNLDFLYNLLFLTYSSSDYRETIKLLPIYPDQLGVLKLSHELSRDIRIPEELKYIYDRIINGNSRSIKSFLLMPKFNEVIQTTSDKTGKSLSEEIYTKIIAKRSLLDFVGHPYEKDIFDIIQRIIDDNTWAHFFPEIHSERSILLMKKVTDDAVKDNLFKIIGSGEKNIKLLGDLAHRNDLADLIKKGDEAIETDKRKRSDFAYKKKIGVHIEDLIRRKIDGDINLKVRINNEDKDCIKVDEIQGGQDIIIELDGSPIYYVEVKSRWDSSNSVYMSKLQLERASKKRETYALCSVDMTKYNGENRHNVQDIEEIKEYIRFVDNIGELVEPLVSNNLQAESTGDNLRLTDYRGLVPQWIINEGNNLDGFIQELCSLISSKLINAESN